MHLFTAMVRSCGQAQFHYQSSAENQCPNLIPVMLKIDGLAGSLFIYSETLGYGRSAMIVSNCLVILASSSFDKMNTGILRN